MYVYIVLQLLLAYCYQSQDMIDESYTYHMHIHEIVSRIGFEKLQISVATMVSDAL